MYLDDILVYSETEDKHLSYLKKVFNQSRESQLCFKLKKCKFGRTEIKNLGYRIGGSIVFVNLSKTEAIRTWPIPACVKDL